MPKRTLTALFSLLLLGACGGDPFWLPRAHRITIQQGNLISERQLQALAPGQSREEVATLLGNPLTATPFHQDRWEYLYTRGPAGTAIYARRIAVLFENDRVVDIQQSEETVSGELPPQRAWWEVLPTPES